MRMVGGFGGGTRPASASAEDPLGARFSRWDLVHFLLEGAGRGDGVSIGEGSSDCKAAIGGGEGE
jgi:hypothetical protein